MKYTNHTFEQLADLISPLGLFLKIRERFGEVLLLESSDYSSKEDSQSFLCFDSLCQLSFDGKELLINEKVKTYSDIIQEINSFLDLHQCDSPSNIDGVFGFTGFEAAAHFEKIELTNPKSKNEVPIIRYDFFRFVIEFDHFRNTLRLIEHCPEGESSRLEEIKIILQNQDYQSFSFALNGEIESNMEDGDYKSMVTAAKKHCQRGDVFQLVLSRRFYQNFNGDDLNVYRSLRSINPSPYLFYFDYGSYKIFGSSPEAQLKIENQEAEIHPIAGTFKRSGNPFEDEKRAAQLLEDPKESSEHIMLVDLARNDLSKNCDEVHVSSFKEVQYFSHVIHLVSIVKGQLKKDVSAYQVFADSFPAGTLSGAPKHKALQLIDHYEPNRRGFYGGGIGMLGFNGNLNHAIVIRSFVSQNNQLSYQAGAGLVISSDEESELQEVNNKLAALNKALIKAQEV